MRTVDNKLIVTNGDQTDTIFDYVSEDATFADALRTREFEPDAPNFTPRISAMLTFADGDFSADMSILRAGDAEGSCCHRVFWEMEKIEAGKCCFLHTYLGDGNPIPSFVGDPETVALGDESAADFADAIWAGLNADNRVSLWTCVRDLATGEATTAIINANK